MPIIKISNYPAFTLIELMISISIIAILTAAAIPSFSGFSKSQALNQNLKSLKSDLRIAQSRSISGSTFGVGSNAKAWGIYFDTGSSGQYTIIACTPAVTLSDYAFYRFGIAGSVCTTTVKTINLGSQVKISNLNPADVNGKLSVVFDAQNGATYANGSQVGATITLSYTDGSSPLPITITAGGGISD